MSEEDLKLVADKADVIVNGYAFTKSMSGCVRVLNLNNDSSAAVLSADGEILETSMDDIELKIIADYYALNRKYMES